MSGRYSSAIDPQNVTGGILIYFYQYVIEIMASNEIMIASLKSAISVIFDLLIFLKNGPYDRHQALAHFWRKRRHSVFPGKME
jgi:hypothetical protein